MAIRPRIEPDDAEPVLRSAAATLRSLAWSVALLVAGLLAGFLARVVGGGILIDTIAAALPAAGALGAIFLAARTLRTGRAMNPDGHTRKR